MRKYYFAYHLVNGNPFPFMWAEEGGLPVGGRPDYVEGTKVEILPKEFEEGTLSILEKVYPWVDSLPNVLSGK